MSTALKNKTELRANGIAEILRTFKTDNSKLFALFLCKLPVILGAISGLIAGITALGRAVGVW